MTGTTGATAAAGEPAAARVARRDWFLLPIIAVLTAATLVVSMELLARRLFSTTTTSFDDCLILDDTTRGIRGVPNAVCHEKVMEGPLVEYRLDSAGFRSDRRVEAKPHDVYRIVIIGSSLAIGERVPFAETLPALLPARLSTLSGRTVEVYGEGMAYSFPRNAALRFPAALAMHPDLVLWVLTPTDVERVRFAYSSTAFDKPASSDGAVSGFKNLLLSRIRAAGGTVVLGNALRHWLYEAQSQNQYVRSYLLSKTEDSEAGFLRQHLSADWNARLQEFGTYAADIAQQARAAGVPVVATLAPNRAQAAMISLGEWPDGYDPFQFGRQVERIIVQNGGRYLDILPQLRSVPSPERLFLPLDGHPDAAGHAALARLITQALGRTVPELRPGALPNADTQPAR